MKIYYDSLQEGIWFQGLHPALDGVPLLSFSQIESPLLKQVLAYDRPDIILADSANPKSTRQVPILVIERTTEVPSGHNVGQRFGRLVAAAQARVPAVYFGPYAAYKHGGATQGPRYMNLRLFYALDKMATIEDTAITTINWPVDKDYELIQLPIKDARVKEYLEMFFNLYRTHGLPNMLRHIMNSTFQKQRDDERNQFTLKEVARPKEYDLPPGSVTIGRRESISVLATQNPGNLRCREVVFYNIGMRYVRSDPYTGMALLYSYLYCGGMKQRVKDLILYFPNITKAMWRTTADGRSRKDIRLYKLAADGILFSDGYLPKESL